ncbi:MAG: 16S rRNA (adenine(1518)-N(6)/adenine(1519)-N(6))-dimethyltransferase RsmA [Syntrophorhabdus sp.]
MLKKRFSQNLIRDVNILRKMVSLASVSNNDTVAEIGSGRGDLTRVIASSAQRVIAIEIDRDMLPYLEEISRDTPNIEIISGDVLKMSFAGLARDKTIKVIGNIPYGITGPIIFKLISERKSIESAYLTVQKEIGIRITAHPGTRAYGSLSVICQLVADVRVLMRIKPQVFIPPPKVESIYFSMTFRNDGDDVTQDLIVFVRLAFSHKRKIMRNALLDFYPETRVEELYEAMQFPRSIRAEELKPEQFPPMYRFLHP